MKIWVTACGVSGKKAELRTYQERQFATFSLACYAGKEMTTLWLDVSVQYAPEKVIQEIDKGTRVTVVGSLNVKQKDGKTYYQLSAQDWQAHPKSSGAPETSDEDVRF